MSIQEEIFFLWSGLFFCFNIYIRMRLIRYETLTTHGKTFFSLPSHIMKKESSKTFSTKYYDQNFKCNEYSDFLRSRKKCKPHVS